MSDPSKNQILDQASNKSPAFATSQEAGTVYYYELCKEMMDNNYTIVRQPSVAAPYAYNDRYWYGYDDPDSTMTKAQRTCNGCIGDWGVGIFGCCVASASFTFLTSSS